MGFSMLAEPLTKLYATLSVWRDEAALDAFARAHPHDPLMTDLAPAMGPTQFVRWAIKGTDGPPSWPSALERLSETSNRRLRTRALGYSASFPDTPRARSGSAGDHRTPRSRGARSVDL